MDGCTQEERTYQRHRYSTRLSCVADFMVDILLWRKKGAIFFPFLAILDLGRRRERERRKEGARESSSITFQAAGV